MSIRSSSYNIQYISFFPLSLSLLYWRLMFKTFCMWQGHKHLKEIIMWSWDHKKKKKNLCCVMPYCMHQARQKDGNWSSLETNSNSPKSQSLLILLLCGLPSAIHLYLLSWIGMFPELGLAKEYFFTVLYWVFLSRTRLKPEYDRNKNSHHNKYSLLFLRGTWRWESGTRQRWQLTGVYG